MVIRFLLLSCIAVTAYGICCPWHPTTNVKCACDDGSHVAPWECCSTGTCNVFCCNCDGECKTGNSTDGYGPIILNPQMEYDGSVFEVVREAGETNNGERGPLSPEELALQLLKKEENDHGPAYKLETRKKRSVIVNGLDNRPAMVSGLEGTILKYKRLDTDGSRGLDVAEVARIFGDMDEDSKSLAKEVIFGLDVNEDGVIQPAEFDKDLKGIL